MLVFAFCAWLSRGQVARAAETPLALSVTGCDDAGVSTARLLELIRTEVAAADFVIVDAALPSAVRGTLERCHGSPELVWMSVSVESQPTVERTVDLSDVEGELRARTLAVAFAELLTLLPREAAASPSPSSPTPSSPAAPAAPPLARPAPYPARLRDSDGKRSSAANHRGAIADASLWVGTGVAARAFAHPLTIFAGPWFSIGSARWQAEAFYLQASNTVALGTAHVRALALAAAWSPWSVGVRPRVSLHCRGEFGMTWATGSPAGDWAIGATRHREQAALAVESRVDLPWSRALAFQARLTTGLVYGPTATADGVTVTRSSGPFVGTALGINIGF